jgi:uncharacterized Zn-binding protein involved in type VI secretion
VKPVRLCLWIVALLSCAEAGALTEVERAREIKERNAEPLIREMSETCWRAEEAQEWRRKLQALPDDPARVRAFVDKELAPLKSPCQQVKREREDARKEAEFEWVIKPRFDGALPFAANGLARVLVNGKWGYINEKGEEVIRPRFDRAGRFDGTGEFAANGLARVKVNGKWGWVNKKGEEVIKPRFDWVWDFAANGLAAVKVNGKWGYINEKGEEVIKPRFDLAGYFAANGLAPVKVNGKYGYINEKDEEVIKPRFDLAGSFAANGLAPVEVNGKWGYLNEKGEEVIKPRFDEARGFAANGLAPVKVNGKWGCIRAPFPCRTDKRPGGE